MGLALSLSLSLSARACVGGWVGECVCVCVCACRRAHHMWGFTMLRDFWDARVKKTKAIARCAPCHFTLVVITFGYLLVKFLKFVLTRTSTRGKFY